MSEKVELAKGEAFELKPGRQYLLIFSKRDISRDTTHQLCEALKSQKIEGVIALIEGDPKDVKVIEDNRNATTKERS